MREPITLSAFRTSRRRLLTLAAGATAVAAGVPAAVTARQPVEATPDAPVSAVDGVIPPISSSLAGDASPLFREVAEAVVQAMEQHLVPGAAVGMLIGDREEHAVFGVASISSLSEVTPDTLFQIGSITKTVTATGIWRLIDEAALEVDAPVRTYLPNLTLIDAEAADQVTVGNLLDHTAGWYGDEGFYTGENDDALARYVAERLPELPQIYPLGAYFSYNNAAFSLLGHLIEISTGTAYRAAIRNLVLDPLGMDVSVLDPAAVRRAPYADGHLALMQNEQVTLAVQTPLWLPRSVDPAGGIWSTTRDLIRYARFHLADGVVAGPANVVHPDTLAQMQEPVVDVPGTTALQMGRDWFVQDLDGVRAVFHGGDTAGQHADLVLFPDHGVAVTVLTNAQGGGVAVGAAALNACLARIPELAGLVGRVGLASELAAPADAASVEVPPDELAAYVGRFADPGQAVTLSATDDGLQVLIETIEQPGAYIPDLTPAPLPEIPVSFLAEDMATIGPSRLPFVRDEDGTVQWVSLGLRLIPRADD